MIPPEAELTERPDEHTVPAVFSADETTDLGRDSATPVSDDHGPDNRFTGRVRWARSTWTTPPRTWII